MSSDRALHPSLNRPSTLPMTAVTGRLVPGRLSEGVTMTDTVQTSTALAGVAPLDRLTAEVEKGQQLAGHFPDAEALDRGQRVYRGELSIEDARAEIDAKYSRG